MTRYTNKESFMHDFYDTTMKGMPYDKTTSTYRRALKRQRRKMDSYRLGLDIESSHRIREENRRENEAIDNIFEKIVDRVQKEQPSLSRIKARVYARKKDPVGRKYDRLFNQGLGADAINKRLYGSSKSAKPSTGKMGH